MYQKKTIEKILIICKIRFFCFTKILAYDKIDTAD